MPPPGRRRPGPSSLLLSLLLASTSSAFYLPGVAPTDYAAGDKVPLNVNHLTPSLSKEDQRLHSLLSYDYYLPQLHFCEPPGGPRDVQESLGSILFGDRIKSSPFDIRMARNETCKVLCENATYPTDDAFFVNRMIERNYNFNWLIDGLPAATVGIDKNDPNFQLYSVGFPLGKIVQEKDSRLPVLNNHYDIIIDYHVLSRGGGVSGVGDGGKDTRYRVVGVEVQPQSINPIITHDAKGNPIGDCTTNQLPLHLDDQDTSPTESDHASEKTTTTAFTYSVYWRSSSTPWATRWDKYLHVRDTHIHWYFLINSTIIVIFLTGSVGIVLLRTLRKDIARYNQLDLTEEDVQEDSGWKLIHGDVFRPPSNPMLLSIFLGSGTQLFVMTGFTIFFALLGFLSPSNRGSLGTVMVVLYALLGFIGGYISARMYKTWSGESWKRNILLTPILVPSIVFLTFILINFFLVFEQSSGAVPFTTMLALVGIWFVISVPLSFAGSWMGFKKEAFTGPVRTNQIPRQIPPGPWWLRRRVMYVVGGALPFGALLVEMHLIMGSIWFHKVYYMFGFLFICYGIMIATTSTTTILLIYHLLCSENYHWPWRAFLTAGSTALYIATYAILFWLRNLNMGGVASNVVYLGYSAIIGFLAFVLTGSIGWFACWAFVRRVYASIKID